MINNTKTNYVEKDKTEAIQKIMSENEYIIVDVRTPEEYKESHIKGAINIEYDKIDENVKLDKNKLIMVYCKSGVRSNKAYQTLISLGFNVYDMGGISTINLDKE